MPWGPDVPVLTGSHAWVTLAGPFWCPMPSVTFTRNLQRHVACPPCAVSGATVRESLEAAFALYPQARSYVLDEHGTLRFHMAIYVDGVPITDRQGLSDPVPDSGQIFIMQALSGG